MQILNFVDMLPGGSVLSEFSISFYPQKKVIYHKWKLMRSKKGALFISGPSFSVVEDDGTKSWHPMIEMEKEEKEDFQKKVLALLQPFIAK